MKINGDVSGVAFSPDGSKVFANSGKSRKGGRVCSCSCHVINLCACVCVRVRRGWGGVCVGHAQQSVCEQVYGRRLREGNFHRHFSKRAVPGLWVRHTLVTMLLSDWLRAVC